MNYSDRSISQTSDLQLLEAPGGDGVFNPDGTVIVVVIRPCDGRGPGNRIYPRSMLEATASKWSGYPSYMNHEDPAARKATAKLRRGPEELAGELRETHWDPTYTAPDDHVHGYEPGAVVGRFMPATDLVESLIRRIPGQLKLSINAQATRLRRAQRKDGKPGWLVEGIDHDPETGSVDLVTAAGAGGRVAALIESADPTSAVRRPVSTMTTDPVADFADFAASKGLNPALFGMGGGPGEVRRQPPLINYRSPADVMPTTALRESPDMRDPEPGEEPWRTLMRNRGVSEEILNTLGAPSNPASSAEPGPLLQEAAGPASAADEFATYAQAKGLDPSLFGMADPRSAA